MSRLLYKFGRLVRKGSNEMGDNTHGPHWHAAANPPNPQTHNATSTNDPGDPWQAAARAFAQLGAINPAAGTGESQLEVVNSDMPILAFRMARLGFHSDGRPFGAVAKTDEWFGVDADATCEIGFPTYYFTIYGNVGERPSHKAPHPRCSCGFYATPLGKEPYSTSRNLVRLLVELSGDVIECELLYRAEHQRVVECQLQRCHYCNRPSEVIALDPDGEWMTQAACSERHLVDRDTVQLTRDDLALLLPVPVTQG